MRKIILMSVIILASSKLVAQENIAKAGVLFGNFGVQYERSISKQFSILGQFGYSDIPTRVNNNDSKSTGIGYYVEGRYYFSSNKALMEGWHIGPHYTYLNLDDKNDDSIKTNISSFGLATGYQWIFNSHVTLGAIAGIGTLSLDSDVKLDLGGVKFLPNVGFTIGYSF